MVQPGSRPAADWPGGVPQQLISVVSVANLVGLKTAGTLDGRLLPPIALVWPVSVRRVCRTYYVPSRPSSPGLAGPLHHTTHPWIAFFRPAHAFDLSGPPAHFDWSVY